MTHHDIADINSLVEEYSRTSAVYYDLYGVCKYKFCLLSVLSYLTITLMQSA